MNPESYIGSTSKSNFDLNQGGPSAWDNTNTTYNNCNYSCSSYNTNDQEATIDHSLFTDYIPSTPHVCTLNNTTTLEVDSKLSEAAEKLLAVLSGAHKRTLFHWVGYLRHGATGFTEEEGAGQGNAPVLPILLSWVTMKRLNPRLVTLSSIREESKQEQILSILGYSTVGWLTTSPAREERSHELLLP
ncbi:hypothetical protein QYF36_018973 [Acer negundo]|nr:hypothetical protein QYF36_018973 [Acer negundo]